MERDGLICFFFILFGLPGIVKDIFQPTRGFVYLEEPQVKKVNAAPGFLQRYNLATVAHQLFKPEPQLHNCERGLTGYVRQFRPAPSNDQDDEKNEAFWKTYLQLVALVKSCNISLLQMISQTHFLFFNQLIAPFMQNVNRWWL